MRKVVVRLSVGIVAILALAAAPVLAAPPTGTLDQEQAGATWDLVGFGGIDAAQTFTAGMTGQLTDVEVNVVVAVEADPTITAGIFATSGGLPTGSPLATDTQTGGDGWLTFNFATPTSVTNGTQYALVIEPAGSITWRGVCSDDYAGGQALIDDEGSWKTFPQYATDNEVAGSENYCVLDFAFRTYVVQPETSPPPTSTVGAARDSGSSAPVSLMLLAATAALAALVTVRRRLTVRR
jgi:hypothetical protein